MYKRLICTFLIIFLLIGFTYATPRANAITFLGISGVVEVVIDPAHIATTIGKWVVDVGKWIVDNALKVALATLKKRLLDSLVDDIITWIQGGGDPQFIQDPGQFFSDAIQSAAGDTAYALGLGQLCTQPLKFRLKLNLIQPRFSQRIRCTLDDIVGNVQAFRNNFQNGSWIAYQETLKPQNNQWGLQLLVQDELLNQISKQTEAKRYEASVGGGFLGQKRCNLWQATADSTYDFPEFDEEGELIGTLSSTDVEVGTTISQVVFGGSTFIYHAYSPDLERYSGKTNWPPGSRWRCTQPETVTPGRTVGDSVAKAIGSDIDFIVGSDDLSIYVAAIVDAAINRIAKESVQGLTYLSRSRSDRSCADLDEGSLVRQACENYESAQADVRTYSDDSLEASSEFNYLGQLATLGASMNEVRDLNDELITVLTELVSCTEGAEEPEDLLSEAENRAVVIDDAFVEFDAIKGLTDEQIEPRFTILVNLIIALNDTVGGLLSQANTDLTACEGG